MSRAPAGRRLVLGSITVVTQRRRFIVGSLCVVVAACGKPAPTVPEAPAAGGTAPITAGAYVLTIIAPDATTSNGQVVPACPGTGPANLGSIMANATVEVAENEAHAHATTAADGTFDLRLSWFGTGRAAWLRGVVVNTMMPPGGATYDARAAFSGSGIIETPLTIGQTFSSALLGGSVTGSVTVSNGAGVVVACAPGTASWSLSRVLR